MADTNNTERSDVMAAFADFCDTVAALRHPLTGCSWDLQQDHRTLRRFMIEEAYEAADAMISGDSTAIRDELGDVLLQVVLNAQIARDKGDFDIVDVIQGVNAKMRRRHPHVFGDEQTRAAGHVPGRWEEIKAAEKAESRQIPSATFAEAAKVQPASLQAHKIGKIAAKIHFDWDHAGEVLGQVKSEVKELAAEFMADHLNKAKVAEEIGDVMFSLAQLCRHLELDPELTALDANRKFLRRFAALEDIAQEKKIEITKAPRETLEELWIEVKHLEKQRP